MKFRLSNTAVSDLIRIHQYGSKRFGEKQADKYYQHLFDCFERIGLRPFAFESVDHIVTGYRRCVCGVDAIYFKVHANEVLIITIIGRQDFTQIFRANQD
jgi:toxin ParE1/3/4